MPASTNNAEAFPLLPHGAIEKTADGIRLVAGRCRKCEAEAFPAADICHQCWSTDIAKVHLSTEGVLYSFSVIHIAPSMWRTPYILGYVDLPGDVRVLAHIQADDRSKIAIDMPVTLDIGEVGHIDGQPVITAVFKPSVQA